ncbi:MAG: hypothetical protein JSW27_23550, partial [Phycisphaerales bacterium]
MKRYMIPSLILIGIAIVLLAPQVGHASRVIESKVRFAPLHIYLDSGDAPLAAYQFELRATAGEV